MQLAVRQLRFHDVGRKDGQACAAKYGFFNPFVAAKFESNPQVVHRPSGLGECLLQAPARAGTRLAQNERLAAKLRQRYPFAAAPRMSFGHHQHHVIACERPKLQVRAVGLAAHQPEMSLATLYLVKYDLAISHRHADAQVWVAVLKRWQQGRKKMLTGDGTRRKEEISTHWNPLAGDGRAGFRMQGKNPLGIGIEALCRRGGEHSASSTVEQGDTQELL